jgi:fumarylacetoacetase
MPLMRSWVESANGDTDFPLNNLPCGVFSSGGDEPRCGMAIGDFILDLMALEEEGILGFADGPLFDVPFWNEVMEAGPAVWADLRAKVTGLLAEGSKARAQVEPHLVPRAGATLAHAVPGGGIHRFLCRPEPCLQRRHHVPGRRERPAAELAAYPDRL